MIRIPLAALELHRIADQTHLSKKYVHFEVRGNHGLAEATGGSLLVRVTWDDKEDSIAAGPRVMYVVSSRDLKPLVEPHKRAAKDDPSASTTDQPRGALFDDETSTIIAGQTMCKVDIDRQEVFDFFAASRSITVTPAIPTLGITLSHHLLKDLTSYLAASLPGLPGLPLEMHGQNGAVTAHIAGPHIDCQVDVMLATMQPDEAAGMPV